MLKKIFNKDNLTKLIILSIFLSLFLEVVVFNRNVLKYHDKYKAQVTNSDGFVKKDGYFVATE